MLIRTIIILTATATAAAINVAGYYCCQYSHGICELPGL